MGELPEAILNAADYLEMRGIQTIKRRDSKEPGRREKELAEIELARMMLRMFKAQAKIAKELLEKEYPGRKAVPPIEPIIAAGEGFWEKIFGIILRATVGGVDIFAQAQTIGLDYALVNVEAAKFVREYVFDKFKVEIEDTTRKVLQDTISDFIETPDMTIGDVMKRLPFDENRSQLVATTEITNAYAEGNQLAGKEMQAEFPDVRVIKTWWTNQDGRVCEKCGPLHGQEVGIDEPFVHPTTGAEYFNPPAPHPGCVLPGNEVMAPGIISGAAKSFYVGGCVEITLSDGRKISVTKNHPILGESGWVRAQDICEGDCLMGTSNAQGMATTIEQNYNCSPAPIEEIFESLVMSGSVVSMRVPVSAEDFHGDGTGIKGDVNIIRSDSFLNSGRNALICEHGLEVVLNRDRSGLGSLPTNGLRYKFAFGHAPTSHGIVGGSDLGRPLFGGHSGPLHSLGFGLASGFNSRGEKSLTKSPSIDPGLGREFVLGFASNVSRKQVIKVRNFDFTGHVYDLQVDPYELYICNGIIAHNCRCWTTTTTALAEL